MAYYTLSCPAMGIRKVFELMAVTKKNEHAASEVISVILIVAVTLILAGVIAVLVFGYGGNIQKTKVVAVTLTRNPGAATTSTVSALYQGGKDAASVKNISFWVNGVDKGGMCTSGTCSGLAVGCRTSFVPGATPAQVTVIGDFSDGSRQIVLDKLI